MKLLITTLIVAVFTAALSQGQPATPAVSDVSRSIVEASAQALGGVQRIRDLQTLRLQGYAQYAYMWGGGNITGSSDAPQKWIAANELQRAWDFRHDAFQLKERRNMLFPFAATFGHAYFPIDQVVYQGTAYDRLPDGHTQRVGFFTQNPLYVDGARIRTLWSLTNPVALLNALLNGRATANGVRQQGKLDIVEVAATPQISLQLAIDRETHVPVSVAWSTAQNNLGEVTFTTTFTGYMPFDGLKLPMGYNTTMDFRDIVYFRLYVDGYVVNQPLDDLQPPASVTQTAAPVDAAPLIEVEKLADGVWRLTGGTTVVEFADHLTLFELYGSQELGQAILAKANTLVPGKQATELIVSHHHFDHTAGFRVAVAKGMKIYSSRANEAILREVAQRPAPHFQDALPRGGDFVFVPVDERLRLSDQKTTLDLYHVVSNNHMADAVFAYLPAQRIMIEGDIGTAASDWQLWPDSYLDNLAYYKITVDRISPVHEKVMTHKELLQFIDAGRVRAEQRNADYRKFNEYLPGYPVFRTR